MPPPRGRRNWQDAARGLNAAVERQLSENQDVVDVAPRDDARRREYAERDRQVEGRSRLAHVGGREIDRDAVDRKFVAGVADGAADAIAALTYARIRKAHHRERRQPV